MRARDVYDVKDDAAEELYEARRKYPPFNSAHEGYAVLLEEVHELWDEVRAKNDGSDPDRGRRMYREAIQVAAMAMRIALEVCE